MANKYLLSSLLIIILLITFGWAIIEMLEYELPIAVWVAILVPFLISCVLISILRDLIPARKMHAIRMLAEDIQLRVKESLTFINMPEAPQEIEPLIQAINQLISYYEDRYKQERDFTANASHELRSPLAGIRLQTEIAIKARTEEQRRNALNNILKAVDRGTRLVEQLLILSRLTADRVDLAMEAVNLGIVVTKIVADHHSGLAANKNIELHMSKWNKPIIEASEQSIEILVDNLIRNSLIYIEEGGKVDVSISNKNDNIIFTVSDNGPGIPENKRQQVLRRFEKADKGTKTGTGLGLAIVKRIADLHNATLELVDGIETENGKGLKVIVTFKRMTL